MCLHNFRHKSLINRFAVDYFLQDVEAEMLQFGTAGKAILFPDWKSIAGTKKEPGFR